MEDSAAKAGFRGGSFLGQPLVGTGSPPAAKLDSGHIAMTYTALASLLILGDDLSRVDRPAILSALRGLQMPTGSFRCVLAPSEDDVRFVYCAAAICFMLGDWSGMDVERATQFILSCQSYEGGLGMHPGQEAHGGCTYTGVAALVMMRQLHRLPMQDELLRWCLSRQVGGFQGRCNKPADTCYTWWIGGTLSLLDAYGDVDIADSLAFLQDTQFRGGGFSKLPDSYPDPVHSYYGIAGLSLAGMPGLKPMDFRLAISAEAAARVGAAAPPAAEPAGAEGAGAPPAGGEGGAAAVGAHGE
eukprot:PLAT12317.1.p2 GENE.PLAT12317.1~~PLAT12317.1.p2  ORF type:complete len:300 (+),score=145.37 PLAT12317.1:268-1167(+)